MPFTQLTLFLHKISGVVKNMGTNASQGLKDAGADTTAAYMLKTIAESADYVILELESYAGAVSNRWKCVKCGVIQGTRGPVRRKALFLCRKCGGQEFKAESEPSSEISAT